jgi:uroporphyrinogen-III synthase
MTAAAKPLAGLGILVTRPAGQADRLAGRIAELGGVPVLFPSLEIAPPSDAEALARAVAELPRYDLAIFISPTSVERFLPPVLERGAWPPGVIPAAVGQGSARALAQCGIDHVLVADDGADSESLLVLPELAAVAGRRVLIVRGEGGRELLADTLRRRGANVDYAECYRRVRPAADPAPLLSLWQCGGVAAVTVTSREVFANLTELLGAAGAPLVRATPLFAPHQRIAAAAWEWGVAEVVATPPGDAGLVSALAEWFIRRHG